MRASRNSVRSTCDNPSTKKERDGPGLDVVRVDAPRHRGQTLYSQPKPTAAPKTPHASFESLRNSKGLVVLCHLRLPDHEHEVKVVQHIVLACANGGRFYSRTKVRFADQVLATTAVPSQTKTVFCFISCANYPDSWRGAQQRAGNVPRMLNTRGVSSFND